MPIGYKVFNPDWTCMGFKYKIGKTYSINEDIELCKRGFHFCRNLNDCFNYYAFDAENKIAVINAIGKVIDGDDKSVTNKIKILKEISWHEALELINTGKNNTGRTNTGDMNTGNCNTGDMNTGNCNTGDRNTGNRNTGDCNTGDWNTGDMNTGNWNTGNRNTGDCNTGDCNTGDWNTGDWNTGDRNTGNWNTGNWNTGNWNTGNWNTGDRNTGNWNSCDYSNGFFNTIDQKISMFNIQTEYTYEEFKKTNYYHALFSEYFYLTKWIESSEMDCVEKDQNPEHETTGGYLKKYSYKEACANWWNAITDKNKEIIKSMPNFNSEIFREITGIEV